MSEALQPILSSFSPALTPSEKGRPGWCPQPEDRAAGRSTVGLHTMKLDMPRVSAPGSVTAVTTKISPTPACVMNIFDPVSR